MIAVAIFAFNRPNHLKNLLDSLNVSKEISFDDFKFYFFLDGARDLQDQLAINLCLEVFNSFKIDKLNSELIIREKNYGLARNIIDGLNSVFNVHEMAIVLEDDLIVSPYFLKYMECSLIKYESNKSVYHVAGFNFFENSYAEKYYFIPLATCWGWGTWKRAWSKFNKNPSEIVSSYTLKMKVEFNMNGKFDYWNQILLNFYNEKSTWAIFWYETLFRNKGLGLHPKISFIKNDGFDGSGDNCAKTDDYQINNLAMSFNYNDLPDDVFFNEKIYKEVCDWHYRIQEKKWLNYIFNKIGLHKRTIKKFLKWF